MRLKVLIFFLVVLGLWWLVQIPRVFTAILLFCALGVNPFTDRAIEARTMVELLTALFALSILLLFRAEWARVARWVLERRTRELDPALKLMPEHPQLSPLPPEPVVPLAMPSQAVSYNPKAGATIPAPVLEALPQLQSWALPPTPVEPKIKVGRRMLAALPALPNARPLVRHAARQTGRGGTMVVTGVRRVWTVLGQLAYVSYRKMGEIGQRLAVEARRAWWLSEPYIRRFDAWLARKLHQYGTTAALLDVAREMERTIRYWVSEARALRRHPVVVDLLRSWRK